MKTVLKSLYDEYGLKKKTCWEETNRIYENEKILIQSLNNYERNLLLRIRDDNDLIVEKTRIDSFVNGVNIGVKLMLEVLYNKK